MKAFIFLLLWAGVSALDETVVEKASGRHVVEAVLSLIYEKCVFDDDKLLMRRLAYVESKDGTDLDTFRSGYYGGIWQVDETKFIKTKLVSNITLDLVKTEYNVEWTAVTWNDLLKPLHSALAARLFLQYLNETSAQEIPSSISDQARFWHAHYNNGSTASEFEPLSNQLTKICSVVIDIAFMLDGSGSVGQSNFEKVKTFVKDVVSKINVGSDASGHSRVSVTVFSNSVIPKFDFNDHHSLASYIQAINSISYPGGGTNTHSALQYLSSNTFVSAKGARSSSVPKVAVVVTDGRSNVKSNTLAAAATLLASGVRVFAVGVGSNLDMQELKAIASDPHCTHLFLLKNFQAFDSFVYQIEQRVCEVETEIGEFNNVTLAQSGVKFYTYNITGNCKILKISSSDGEANVYYSLTYQPNPARFENVVTVTPTTSRLMHSDLDNGTAFITIEALTNVSLSIELLKANCSCPNGMISDPLGPNFFQCTLQTQSSTTKAPSNYDCGPNNPCSPSVIIPLKFHYPHHDKAKFVQCSEWGQCFVMPCPPTLIWNDINQICDF